MGLISLRELTLGQPNSTEDADVISNFTTLLNLVNGNIDTNNLSSRAGIVGDQLKDANVTYAKLAADVASNLLKHLAGTELRMTGVLSTSDTGVLSPGSDLRLLRTVTHNLGLRTPGNVVLVGGIYGSHVNNPSGASWSQVTDSAAANSCQVQIQNAGDRDLVCSWRGFAIGWGGFS